MTENPNRDDHPQRDEVPSSELHGLIEPDRSQQAAWDEATRYVEAMRPKLLAREERAERYYFGEEGKERSRRTRIYSHSWAIKKGCSPKTPFIAQDAALLAEHCRVPLQLSASIPQHGPLFSQDVIAFNGRGDACEDFIYPPSPRANRTAGLLSIRSKCRTECRDYDTVVSAILLSIKHHLGNNTYVTSTGKPDSEGWAAAFEIYARTFPEREIPALDNWPK